MKNKIEIQISSPASREQLIEFRDEIRKIEGLEAFDLQVAPAPLVPGKMDGLSMIILEAVISGVAHFTAEKSAEHYQDQIAGLVNRVMGMARKKPETVKEPMSGVSAADGENWKLAISGGEEGKKTVTCYDETGAIVMQTRREYSIDPENTYAILVGNSQYDDRANFSPIPPVAGNLDEMYRVLSDKALVGIPYTNITRLYNETCIEIKDRLRNITRSRELKTLIFYYSGHGQNTGNNQLSLIAKDTRNIDEELHNDLPYSFVEKMLNSSPADQKIVIIDACHSGLAAQGSNSNVFDFEPVLGTFTLASTSAEESSYFKRDSENTYFTSFLTEAFREGIRNSHPMLSLTDLYDYTNSKLLNKNLPGPVCKSQLKNISADNFFISSNPSFSIEARLGMPKQLYQQGRYEEARREYIKLEKEYPDNQALRNEHVEFERNYEFNRLVKEGDLLFFREKNFPAARAKYEEALAIKRDDNVRDKIADCVNSVKNQQPFKKELEKESERDMGNKKNKEEFLKKQKMSGPPAKKPALYRFGLIALAGLIGLYFLLKPKEYQLKDFDGTPYTYIGGMVDGRPQGSGKALYPNGDCYEGQWNEGVKLGLGRYEYQIGSVYTGYFKNNSLNGTGKMVYKDKSVYDGQWVFNNWQGTGTFTDKDGNHYEGWFNNNMFNGHGVYTLTNGDKYDGNYLNGARDGFGTYTSINLFITNCPNCKTYAGDWKKGLKEGHGKCFDASGVLIYEGQFANNKPVDPIYPYR